MSDDQTDSNDVSSDVKVLGTGALKALAHPLRIAMYDILSQHGPQTASSLAEWLGESSGSTSYHLRALAKHDLIREVADKGNARERWWERPAGIVTFTNPDALRTPAGRAASQVVMTEFYHRQHRQLLDYLAAHMDGELDEADDSALLSTASARLTPAQLGELTNKVSSLIDETVRRYRDQTGPDVRTVTIRAQIFPLD